MTTEQDPQRAALERALGAQYEILRLLGRGGMGAVYLAREKALERLVAIKVLPQAAAATAETEERFRREARTAARLTHPNIVPLYTFGDADGMPFFVMGYVKGESLGERIKHEGKLPEEDARRILAELADALAYAHRQGVVHRDIKPDNILLDDETGRPMLTDFGVAKAQASGTTLTAEGSVVGTPHYMSPEQASGARDLDGRSDLYSLGVMGYQMLAGRLPFEGETFQDLILQHVSREPAPLAALAPDAAPDLADTVMRCLVKDPARRWTDGQQLRAALSATDDEFDVPAEEARFEGAAFWCLTAGWAGAVFGLVCALFPSFGAGKPGWWQLPAAIVAAGPLLLGGTSIEAHLRGVSWAAIRRRALYPPRWWPFWWPRRWRRPGDVWARLPGVIRWSRIVGGASLVWFAAISLPLLIAGLALGGPEPSGALGNLIMLAWGWPGWGIVGAGIAPIWWAHRRGIGEAEYARLAFAPTSRLAIWRRPKFAALLVPPARSGARLDEPRTAPAYQAAIAEAAAQFTGDLRAIGREAADGAGQLASAIDSLDAEIAQLARDASPAELEAVEQKLAAMGDAADDNVSRGQMRTLLVSQRDLLRRLGDQLEAATTRRAHLTDLLKALWLQIANLRAQAVADAAAGREVTGKIRALCLEISAHAQAAEAVRAIAP